jgi:sugar-specific transcriptional regulator TrmB
MEEQTLISHIEELGLSNKEARIYVSLLTLGPSPVQRIADQSGIKRVTTYVILESLVGLGLVSQSVKGKKTYFIAEDPTNLRRLLEKREHELKEQKHNFEQVLPELQGLKVLPKESPTVKFYDSPDGIKTIMNAYLEQLKDPDLDFVYGFSNLDQLFKYFPEYKTASANPTRLRSGVKSHFLYTSSEGPIFHDTDDERNRESRYLPPDIFPMNGDFVIVGDNVLMMSLSGSRPIGVAISSKELSQGLKAMFMVAWEAAGILGKR